MKLIDLLVKELPKLGGWPEGVTHIGQEYDRELMFYGRGNISTGLILNELAIDHRKLGKSGEKITRAQYEAALAASKAVVGHDGWIQWAGGECPVDSDAIVEVKYRRSIPFHFNNDRAGDFDWAHTGSSIDIIAYRLHKPQQEEQPEAGEEDMNECIGQAPGAEWNGEGLPPVGCECEYLNSNGEWSTVKVKYSSDQLIVISGATKILGEEQETEIAKDIIIDKPQFRPLRMGPEKKRDAFINAVLDDMRTIPWACDLSLRDEVAVIYDAIAAGKIPGVKLEGK